MKRKITKQSLFLVLLLLSLTNTISAQTKTTFYNKDYFSLNGTLINDSIKENGYDRLPLSYKGVVRDPVWTLSETSAGMFIDFSTNSSSIKVKWELLQNKRLVHMAGTGVRGLDLYFKNNDTWQYINTAKPYSKKNEYTLVKNMKKKTREYRIYLPLYDGVKDIEIGIDSSSFIKKSQDRYKESIIFYGTSITQGGCASRPGMAHTNIISRKLGMECINYGFSGNGKMEEPIVQLISNFNPKIYIIECLPNMTPEQVSERAIPLVKIIRSKHPKTPIVFVDNFRCQTVSVNYQKRAYLDRKNKALKDEYDKMIDQGYKNVYFIDSTEATGNDHEGTVDSIHFTDLGFMRYSNFLIQKLTELKLID